MTRNVGLLGGSFDPVHAGHLALAETALNSFALDEIRFLPCAQQALKDARPTAAKDRCAMLRLALAREPRFTLDSREVRRGGRTYTFDTLTALQAEEPQTRFWFIMGMDSVCSFPKWHRAAELIGKCEFIVFDRPGIEPPPQVFSPELLAHRIRGPLSPLSSTDIRRAVAKKHSIRYSICDLEERYLRDHHLYL